MWWLVIQLSHETFKTALPDQAPCTTWQAFGEFQKKKKKKSEHEEQKQSLKATTSSNVSALRATYLLANCITKAKPFTIDEKLILPAADDICCELLGKAAV